VRGVVIEGVRIIIRPALTDAMYKTLYSISIMESLPVSRPAVSPSPTFEGLMLGVI